MLVEREHMMDKIDQRHVAELVRWGAEYGRSLDSAVEITVRHAEQLIDHHAHRLRRRIAGPALLEASKTIADCLFLKLPESKGELEDVATTQEHSISHYVWPRAVEMDYQVRLAQYRAAWQQLSLAVSDLRREQPDPVLAHELWRSATAYAHAFAPLVPTGMADQLRQAYAQMVTECVAETDRDSGGPRQAPRRAGTKPERAAPRLPRPRRGPRGADQQPGRGHRRRPLGRGDQRARAGPAGGDGLRDLRAEAPGRAGHPPDSPAH
ncbi:MAG: hypothetical protein QM820_65455 [Minicystis sp.]